ncbi:MAG: hypothetical protein OEY01_08140 [Desulfobulbaceae bacterium]|nr:hypothetical protein [Desulfobulbaceae bacterium]
MDYSVKSDFVKELDRDISEYIQRGVGASDEQRFNELALREFELQYRTMRQYRNCCRMLKISPLTIDRWDQIPALCRFSLKRVLGKKTAFHATGFMADTICDCKKKSGKKYITKTYSALQQTTTDQSAGSYLFPTGKKMKIMALLPRPSMAPGMVMASGAKRIIDRFGAADSRFLISPLGLDLKGLIAALLQAEKTGEPIALIGGTRDFNHLLDALRRADIRFTLPQGSLICDSGGYMGLYRESSPAEFQKKCFDQLGITEDYSINALWLCGCNTIFFDNSLKTATTGKVGERCKELPCWVKTIVVDTRQFKRVAKGELGLIRHYDLSNRGTGFSFQLDILGRETDQGFEVLGKWDGELGSYEFAEHGQHPGGRLATQLTDYMIRRKFAKIKMIYSKLLSKKTHT